MNSTITTSKSDNLYRNGVGILVINKDKNIFIGNRIDSKNADAWQIPQGGLDDGENEEDAMFRELKEETGISSDIKILSKSKDHYYYDLPCHLQKKFWGGKYLGQKQRWFLIEFLGSDNLININNESPEFSEWKWISKEEITKIVVSFRRQLYINVIGEFHNYF